MTEQHPPLVILAPVLRRPHRVSPLIDSVFTNTPPPVRLLFIVDPGDHGERRTIRNAGGEELVVQGNYAQKVNTAVELTAESLIFLGADDLNFWPGWLEAALAKLTGDVQVVGTSDLCNVRTNGLPGHDHSTHTLLTRAYAESGTIDGQRGPLFEGYAHEYVDDEFVATAKARGVYAHAPDSVVEHLHPMAGKAPMDALYQGQRLRMKIGRRIFRQREHLWA